MSRFALLAAVAVIVACAKQDNAAADSSAAAALTPPATVSLADFAGTWSVRALPETGDSTLITYDLMATADTTSWMMHLPNGQTVPIRILSVAGDSVVTQAGPYASALRQNVQVSVDAVNRLQGGQLVGTFVAHYNITTADSVLRGRLQGTKK